MAQRIKSVSKYTTTGGWSTPTPLGADAENIDVRLSNNTTGNLQSVLGIADSPPPAGSIQHQLNTKLDNFGDISSTYIGDPIPTFDSGGDDSTDLISEDISTDSAVVVIGGPSENIPSMWGKFNRFRKRVDNKFKTYFSDNLKTAIATSGDNETAYSTLAINNYLNTVIGYTSSTDLPSNEKVSDQLLSLKDGVKNITSNEGKLTVTKHSGTTFTIPVVRYQSYYSWTKDNLTLNGNSYNNIEMGTASGVGTVLVPINIHIANASTGGTNATHVCLVGFYTENRKAHVQVKNTYTQAAKYKIQMGLLVLFNGYGA